MLEANIEETAVNRATRYGWVVRKVSWQGRRGACDRVFFGNGRCVFMEFKKDDTSINPDSQQGKEFARIKARYPEVYEVKTVSEAMKILGIPD